MNCNLKSKQAKVEKNKRMIAWFQSEIDKMKSWNDKSMSTMKKIFTYEEDIARRKLRIKQHKKDIIIIKARRAK